MIDKFGIHLSHSVCNSNSLFRYGFFIVLTDHHMVPFKREPISFPKISCAALDGWPSFPQKSPGLPYEVASTKPYEVGESRMVVKAAFESQSQVLTPGLAA